VSLKKQVEKAKSEIRKLTKEEWAEMMNGEIDPMKYAGEGWFSTEEIPVTRGISNPYLRQEIGREGDYYPGRRKRK
jgi:hypothetical protein